MYILKIVKKIIDEFKFIDQISLSDLMSWILGALSGIIVYKFIQLIQNNMQRHQVIKDVESCINNVFSSNIAFVRKIERRNRWLFKGKTNKYKIIKEERISIRTVLHNKTPWSIYYDGDKFSYITKDKKYIKIRGNNENEEYISTQALHEMLIIFRRIEKLYKDKVLKDIDLADLWRELMPFGVHGRLEFFASYFGKEDVQVIAFVIFNTLIACKKYKINKAINYFINYYIQNVQVHNYFYENSRFRIREKFKKIKFHYIVYK